MHFRDIALLRLAAFTRRHSFRGLDRALRLLSNPDARQTSFLETTVAYDRGRVNIRTSSFIEWFIFFRGEYEPELAEFIREHVTGESIAIDVGANIGAHTIVLSRASRVLAVEPFPPIAERLRENLRISRIHNVEVIEAALSDESGEARLYLPASTQAIQSATIHGDINEMSRAAIVRTLTLDELAFGLPRLDFVKIDTDGHDARVLMGGMRTLACHRPVVVFEWHQELWSRSGQCFDDARQLLESLDYDIGLLTPAFLRDRSLRPLAELTDFDLVAGVPRSRT